MDKNLHLLLLLYLLRLSLLLRTTLCFFYLDIRSRVECRTVLHSIGSPHLTPPPSIALTYLLFFIAPLAVVPTLTSPLLFSLVLSCSWEVLWNLCSNHLPILITFPLTLVFLPNERLLFLNFRKGRQDDFAFYFDSHCPSAEE